MPAPASINPRIVDSLYSEAMELSDEVRHAFTLSGKMDAIADAEDEGQIAFSCEALRTTTRMMHALAWLLNHRAFFAGEISEFQLRRHGRLADFPASDPRRICLLDDYTRSLVLATERFHARLMRIDGGWRQAEAEAPSAVVRLRERLAVAK